MRALSTFAAFLMMLVSCATDPARDPANDARILDYSLRGSVVRVDREHQIATIKHEAITDAQGKVWMEPMTMEFPVRESQDLAVLKPGVRIRARVRQRQADFDYWIDKVQTE